ncbi:hypothetical protein EMCG_07479 [[Emmonsia] crescens]|uniref:F-box domain-containing protein n=1 Tax=[Emmonsia] crescens TaxID=73230 RepID=A0A0G2I8C2_9EURO|nr:hypothetical protein EMCG_07479 [Emmonsia crescens UAMH 3008]
MQRSQVPCSPRPNQQFLHLPTELHVHITSHLPYPDALALKHTNNYFYTLVRTSISLRIDWVIERLTQGLPILWKKCEFRSEVRQTMQERRQHREFEKVEVGVGGDKGVKEGVSW